MKAPILGNPRVDCKLKVGEGSSNKTKSSKNPPPKMNTPQVTINPPYPQRLRRKNDDAKFQKLLSMFNTLPINIPLVEAFLEMSGYAKFMKELVRRKRNLEFETIEVSHHYSAIMSNNLVVKKEDPRAFAVPCTIGVF